MRRLTRLVLPMLLALAMLAAPGVATADTGADPTVLAAEAGEPSGPDPMPREAENNPARELAGYGDRELQFTWGAAWLLLFLGLLGLAVMLVVYQFMVEKPSRENAGRS